MHTNYFSQEKFPRKREKNWDKSFLQRTEAERQAGKRRDYQNITKLRYWNFFN